MESKRLMVTLPIAVIERLERLSEEKHVKKSAVITLALEEYEKKQGRGARGESK